MLNILRGLKKLGRTALAAFPKPCREDEPLLLFLDESGNLDFSSQGTSYFIMTCLVPHRPFSICHTLLDIKYALLSHGIAMRKFHATEDNSKVRTRVFDAIAAHPKNLRAYAIIAQKEELPIILKDAGALYSLAFEQLINEVLESEINSATQNVIVITDEIPKEARKKEVERPLKKVLKTFSQKTNIETQLEHFPSESDFNLQIVDYLCWAFMRREAKGHTWPYSKVEKLFIKTQRLQV